MPLFSQLLYIFSCSICYTTAFIVNLIYNLVDSKKIIIMRIFFMYIWLKSSHIFLRATLIFLAKNIENDCGCYAASKKYVVQMRVVILLFFGALSKKHFFGLLPSFLFFFRKKILIYCLTGKKSTAKVIKSEKRISIFSYDFSLLLF